MKYIVEYRDFQGEWRLRGEYTTYSAALARWRQHYQHCPYLICRIRTIKTKGVVMILEILVLVVIACLLGGIFGLLFD